MSDDGKYKWAGTIVKYVVLPIAAIAIIWYAIQQVFGNWGGQQTKATSEAISQVWTEYDKEYKDFMVKGYLTQAEEDTLNAKLGLIKVPIEKLADSVPNVNEMVISLGIAIIGAITIYEALRHAGDIATNWKKFADAIRNKASAGGIGGDNGWPSAGPLDAWTYSTPEELGTMFKISSNMEIADAGNVALASQAMTALSSSWATSIIPQMNTNAAVLAAQIPLLQGMQLALAQDLLATYQMYIQAFAVNLPPIFDLPPPI